MHGAEWPKVGATLALMWLKRFEKYLCVCFFYFSIVQMCVIIWVKSAPLITVKVFFINQGSTIYPSLPSKPGGRWKGRQQPKPHSGQCHQSVWNSPEEVSRLVGATAFQGRFRIARCVFYKRHTCKGADLYFSWEMYLHGYKMYVNVFAFRQLCSLPHINQISWRLSPRAETSRKRSAWRKSENS